MIAETFGPTWQGEGPSLGRRAGFVRLGRCPLACSWCDTPYTWDWSRFDPANELTTRSTDDVAAEMLGLAVPLVVVTGGEPMVQQRHLAPLLRALRDAGIEVEIETAGIIAPLPETTELVSRFNVSPKLANSGNPIDRRYKPDALRALQATGKAVFKFVAAAPDELDEVATIVEACGLTNIWIMPEGTDAATVTARAQELADAVLARGWNLTTRLHVLLWGDRRGV